MSYQNQQIAEVAEMLRGRIASEGRGVLRAVEIKSLFDQLKTMPPEQRGEYGKELNQLKHELEEAVEAATNPEQSLPPIDVTAPFDLNVSQDKRPALLPTEQGSRHPLMTELDQVISIFQRMGFVHMEARQLDDEYHMFDSLNFPTDHPARDDYDTFMTDEGLVAPAHVSVMQNRLQKKYKSNLSNGDPIAVVYTGRTFRNEDVDARHEHTFYQVEISYIGEKVDVGNLIATF